LHGIASPYFTLVKGPLFLHLTTVFDLAICPFFLLYFITIPTANSTPTTIQQPAFSYCSITEKKTQQTFPFSLSLSVPLPLALQQQ
jgi:hypothetical protein